MSSQFADVLSDIQHTIGTVKGGVSSTLRLESHPEKMSDPNDEGLQAWPCKG